jgi:hypothetical protein
MNRAPMSELVKAKEKPHGCDRGVFREADREGRQLSALLNPPLAASFLGRLAIPTNPTSAEMLMIASIHCMPGQCEPTGYVPAYLMGGRGLCRATDREFS